MTKKKAIEAAIKAGWEAYAAAEDSQLAANNRLAEVSADHAYDRGRIAGLREARQFMNPSYDTEADMVMDITDFANQLAKKARAK